MPDKVIQFNTLIFCSILLAILLLAMQACSEPARNKNNKVTVGAEVLLRDHLDELKGRNVGLVMNPTARINGIHMLDTLLSLQVNIQALYAPEHGFRGDRGAGEHIEDGFDTESGLPVFSLYGQNRKPSPEMLEPVDLILFDMQDVGARFYTYISTMGLVLEAAAENDVEVWILDRPNPAGGDYVSGWVLEPEYSSFVGAYPIPVAHGMTLGEIAQMAVGENWLNINTQINYRVIPNENLTRDMRWPDTGLEWVPPSPNLPEYKNALVYLGTCFFEGTTLSEGRGTEDPFLKIGSPTLIVDTTQLERFEHHYQVQITPIQFMPISIAGVAPEPKFQDTQVHGIEIGLDNYSEFDPVAFGVELLRNFLLGDKNSETKKFLYNLAGTKNIDDYLISNTNQSPNSNWENEVNAFKELRKPYLIY
ncbi:MAG: DUF1343 domain-containing protein [Balneolales bacterium]